MLIKRLLHHWVLMEEAGGDDGGAAGSGGAVSVGSGADGATGSGGASGATGNAGDGTAATAAEGAQSGQAAGAANADGAKPGVDLEALKPPAALTDGGEAKPEDGKEAPKDGESKPDDKPVEYTDFKLPEGMTIEDESLKAFKDAAAGAKLTQDQAQAFVDLHAKALVEAATKPYEVWRDTQKQWQEQIKADPEFGGAKLEKETIPAIARAIKAFSPSPEAEQALRQAFHFTGAGNNPEMIRFMARIGKSLAEGSHVGGKPSGNDGKSAAAMLYPSTQASNGQS